MSTNLVQTVKRVQSKGQLLFRVAEAAVGEPDGVVRDVVFPVVGGETTLRAVIDEFAAIANYETTVNRTIRSSYANHYRRMVPPILRVLSFQTNNPLVHQ